MNMVLIAAVIIKLSMNMNTGLSHSMLDGGSGFRTLVQNCEGRKRIDDEDEDSSGW